MEQVCLGKKQKNFFFSKLTGKTSTPPPPSEVECVRIALISFESIANIITLKFSKYSILFIFWETIILNTLVIRLKSKYEGYITKLHLFHLGKLYITFSYNELFITVVVVLLYSELFILGICYEFVGQIRRLVKHFPKAVFLLELFLRLSS